MLNYVMVPKDFSWNKVVEEIFSLQEFYKEFNNELRTFDSEQDAMRFLKMNKKFFASLSSKRALPKLKLLSGKTIPTPNLLGDKLFWSSNYYIWIVANFGYVGAVRLAKHLTVLVELSKFLTKVTKFDDKVRLNFRQFKKVFHDFFEQTLEKYEDYGPFIVGPSEIRCQNLDRMASEDTEILLNGLQTVIKIFNKNGFQDVLKSAKDNQYYYVLPREGGNPNTAAFYNPHTKNIVVYSVPFAQQTFVRTFIHEFGHLLWFEYIGSKARDYWFESWQSIQQEQDKRVPALQTILKVTYKDRQYFFEMLKKNTFDLKKTEKKIRKPLQVKYRAWLYNPSGDFPQRDIWLSYLPDQIEPTLYATKHFLPFFKLGPEKYSQKYHVSITDPEKLTERFMRALGLAGPNVKRAHPVINWGSTSKQLSFDDAKRRALEELEPPTEYSKTDALEDFSETFSYYLTQPNKLSSLAKRRVIKTLKIAGLYKGKIPFFASEGYFEEKDYSMTMKQSISNIAAKLVLAGYTDEAICLVEASTKTSMNDPASIALSLDSLVQRNNGLWKSDRQGDFLLSAAQSPAFQRREAQAWAKKQKVPFTKAIYYQVSIEGYGKINVKKIRMRGMVYLLDQGGVVLRGKVPIIHPKGDQGGFIPNWSSVQINFRRPKDVVPKIIVEDPEAKKQKQIKKNQPIIRKIKTIPNWEDKRILVDFIRMLENGYTLSPAQMNVVKRMLPDGFKLADREQWQKNFDTFIENIRTKVLPAHRRVFEITNEQGEYSDQDWQRYTQEFNMAEREYKSRGYTSVSWIGAYIIHMLEALVGDTTPVAIDGEPSEELYRQHQKALRAKKPSKKAIKNETFIQKVAEKLSSMSKQQVFKAVERDMNR